MKKALEKLVKALERSSSKISKAGSSPLVMLTMLTNHRRYFTNCQEEKECQ
jgi:hypothetical protein